MFKIKHMISYNEEILSGVIIGDQSHLFSPLLLAAFFPSALHTIMFLRIIVFKMFNTSFTFYFSKAS